MPVPLRPLDRSTPGASLTGVVRIDIGHGNASLQGLVFDKGLKLPKGPGVGDTPLLSSQSDTLPDVRQVFQDQGITGLTYRDNFLADSVVQVGHPPSFLARQPFQEPFCSLRALGLKSLSKVGVVVSDVFGLFAGELLPTGGGGQIVDAPVNSNRIGAFREGNFPVNHNVNVELPLALTEGERCGGRLLLLEETPLEVAQVELKPLETSIVGSNGDGFLPLIKTEGASIERETGGAKGLGNLLPFLGYLDGFGYPGNGPNDQVGLEAVFIFDLVVAEVLQLDLVGCPMLEGNLHDIVAGSSKPPQGFMKDGSLCIANLDFTFNSFNKLHGLKFITFNAEDQPWRESEDALPPPAKAGGFRARFL